MMSTEHVNWTYISLSSAVPTANLLISQVALVGYLVTGWLGVSLSYHR